MTPIESRDELVAWFDEGASRRRNSASAPSTRSSPSRSNGHEPVPYDGPRGIRALLDGMQHLLGWEPIMEGRTSSASPTSPAAARSRSSRAGSSSCPARRSRPSTRPASELMAHLAQVREIAAPARHRLPRPRHDAELDARRHADDAEGPLQDHDRLHAEGRHATAST